MREWLVDKRESKGLTKVALSIKVGISEASIGKYERGERTPKPYIAMKLGKILGFKWTKFYS